MTKSELFVKFQITDTGRGFTDKEADALFKRFSQIDGSSTRQHGGTGLGLVISRQLAHLHGGDMSATGFPNKGSTFTFFVKTTLPTLDDQPPPRGFEFPSVSAAFCQHLPAPRRDLRREQNLVTAFVPQTVIRDTDDAVRQAVDGCRLRAIYEDLLESIGRRTDSLLDPIQHIQIVVEDHP